MATVATAKADGYWYSKYW